MSLLTVSIPRLCVRFSSIRTLFLSSMVNMCRSKTPENLTSNSRPATPTDDDCCGNACQPCVYDVHKTLLDKWERRKLESVKRRPENNTLKPLTYTKFIITEITEVAEGFIKVRLAYQRNDKEESAIFLKPSQHVILSVNELSRAYTPISWTSRSLDLVVKVHSNGAFSPDSKRPKIGDEIRVRGPYGEFVYKTNSFRQIVAFCIGSGIAAIYPVAKAIAEDETEETRIRIVAGFRTLGQIPLKKELRLLADYWNVDCTLQLSSSVIENVTSLNGVEIRRGSRLNRHIVTQLLDDYSPEETLVLICGTPQFGRSLEGWVKDHSFVNCHVF